MERIAQLLWDPFLCVLYLMLGLFFVLVTGGVAFRRSPELLKSLFVKEQAQIGSEESEVEHRDAFFSALAASVGVGNLAGVATALHLGGPGALFWMWMSALCGMSFRMAATYFAVKYRPEPGDLRFATPMVYLERFLPAELSAVPKIVAVLLVGAGLLNANLIQANSVADSMTRNFGLPKLAVAIGLTAGVTAIVIGGLRSIVRVSTKLAPWMVGFYVAAGSLILLSDPSGTSKNLSAVLYYAFHDYSVVGGVAGYLVFQSLQFGVSRGIFSHGSGMGMAPFFQGANTDHPARGALLAATVPVFDTLIVCTITALVILSNGFWQFWTGARLTVSSFGSALGTPGEVVVFACLLVFALTTVISWAHFSERCFAYLGGRNILGYRLFFCFVTFLGPFFPVALVWSLADTLLGLLLIAHLLPLTYVVIKRGRTMMRDLETSFDEESSPHEATAPRPVRSV